MSPFLSNSRTYHGYVKRRDGSRVIRTLGTRDYKLAVQIQQWLNGLARARSATAWATLDAIAEPRGLRAIDAYDMAHHGTLEAWLTAQEDARRVAGEPDLEPLVLEWSRVATSHDYVRQVRSLIVPGVRFPVSGFSRKALSQHLAALPVSGPTKNRYRVAFYQFARWLIEREVLDANPVREVRGFGERDPRMTHYTHSETLAISRRLPAIHQVLEALMWGAGLEVSACLALRRRDINTDTREVMARGTKSRWRARTVRVTHPDAWALIEPYVRSHTPDALLFAGLTERGALDIHKAACRAAGVEVSTLHDWRHTYAIRELRAGMLAATVKRQLGHSPHSTMLERVYGAFVPAGDADYVTRNVTRGDADASSPARTKTRAN